MNKHAEWLRSEATSGGENWNRRMLEAAIEIDRLRNDVNTLNNLMRDKGFGQGEIDLMGWQEEEIEAMKKVIAAKDAVIEKLLIGKFNVAYLDECQEIHSIRNDDTALQEMLKQAKRDLLINLADHFDRKGWYQAPNDLRRMAGEIK